MKKIFSTILSLILVILLLPINAFAYTDEEYKALQDKYNNEIQIYKDITESMTDTIESLKKENPNPTPQNNIPERPVITLGEPTYLKLVAGTTTVKTLNIKNMTSYTASNVVTKVTSVGESSIIVTFDNSSNFSNTMSPSNTAKLDARISVPETVASGTYALTLTHTYLNNKNEEQTSTSVVQINIVNDSTAPNISLRNINVSPASVVPGQTFTLKAELYNAGIQEAKNIQISIDNLTSDTIFIKDSTNILDLDTLKGSGKKDISITFSSNKKIKTGSYPINLKITYLNNEAKETTRTYVYNVFIDSGTTQPDNPSEIQIESITAPGSTITVGNDFSMTVTVKNTSKSTAKNIKITAKPADEAAVVPKSTSILQIRSLDAGKSEKLTFKFAPTAASKSQNYVIGFTLEYATGESSKVEDKETPEIITFTQFQGVNVSNPEADKKEAEKDKEKDKEEKKSVPKIIISSYRAEPQIVQAGRDFDLSLTFANTSHTNPIKNIKAFLTVEDTTEKKGNVFSPVNSSNTFYIDSIGPGGNVTRNITLFTVPDAAPKTYDIIVNFEYEDIENNPLTSKEFVGINVKQITKLDTSEIIIDQMATVGVPFNINFQLYNTGKVQLSNLLVKIEGNDFTSTSGLSSYFGKLDVGSVEYYDNQIMSNTPGQKDGKIIFTYEDDTGEVNKIEKDFTVNVMEMNIDERYDPSTDPNMVLDEKTGQYIPKPEKIPFYKNWKILLPAGASVLVAAIVVVVVVRRKRRQDQDE